MHFIFWSAIGVIVGAVFGSFFEWSLHRYLMHRPFWKFRYPYQRHALTHHRIFKADHTYHLIHDCDKHTIPMAWWNGPVLIALTVLPFVLVACWSRNWGLLCGEALASSIYYAAYEYMHWCMHLPKKRHVERSGVFFRLNGHHLLHHRYVHKNYNVVSPWPTLSWGHYSFAPKSISNKPPAHSSQTSNPKHRAGYNQ